MQTLFISPHVKGGGSGGDKDEKVIGSFLVSPQDKQEFRNVLASLKRNLDEEEQLFRVDV